MKKLKRIIGYFLVLMCITELFLSIVATVIIITPVENEVYWAKQQLPILLLLTVIFGLIAFYLLCDRQANMEKQQILVEREDIPVKKMETGYKVLIYLSEAVIAWLGTFIISGVVMLITNNRLIMQLTMPISFIGIIYFLPSPQEVFNYWKKNKYKGNTH